MLAREKIWRFDRSKRDRFYVQTGGETAQKGLFLGHQGVNSGILPGDAGDFAGRCRDGTGGTEVDPENWTGS